MGSYIVRRLLLVPFLLVGIATLTFIVSHTIPADPLATLVSERQLGNAEVVRAAKEQWGLDKAFPSSTSSISATWHKEIWESRSGRVVRWLRT